MESSAIAAAAAAPAASAVAAVITAAAVAGAAADDDDATAAAAATDAPAAALYAAVSTAIDVAAAVAIGAYLSIKIVSNLSIKLTDRLSRGNFSKLSFLCTFIGYLFVYVILSNVVTNPRSRLGGYRYVCKISQYFLWLCCCCCVIQSLLPTTFCVLKYLKLPSQQSSLRRFQWVQISMSYYCRNFGITYSFVHL